MQNSKLKCEQRQEGQRIKMSKKREQEKLKKKIIIASILPSVLILLGILKPNLINAEAVISPTTTINPVINTSTEDKIIKNAIIAKINADPRITARNIEIKLDKGVVSILGTFNTVDEAQAMVEDASTIPGVTDINTSSIVLLTGSDPSFPDLMTASRIKGLFIRDAIFGEIPITEIHIVVREGIVYISGNLDNIAAANRAVALAKSVSTVREVIPRFTVRVP